ncbi:MAG: MFS transporter [Bryobacteraceae bacterium]
MSTEPSVLRVETPVTFASRRAETGMMALALYCAAHFFIDLYSSALGAFQPILVDKLHMSLTQAGWLGAMMTFSGSFVQPAYGFLSDRYHSRLFTALAPAASGLFISMIPLSTSFGMALGLVAVGAAGIASFHPQASARATLGIQAHRGRWMAVFISCGSLGLAIGPVFFSAIITSAGAGRTYLAAIPGLLMTLVLLAALPEGPRSQSAGKKLDLAPLVAVWRPLTILYLLVFLRSAVQITYGQFLPLYLHRERGLPLVDSSLALTIYLTAGAVGGFIGGHMADRFGGKRVIQVSMLACVPFLALFFYSSGWVSMLSLAAGGLMLLFTVPVNVVMAQELAPSQAGTVSALMMGFAWGFAGLIFIPLTGFIAEHSSLHFALGMLTICPLVGFFFTFLLAKDSPSDRHLTPVAELR